MKFLTQIILIFTVLALGGCGGKGKTTKASVTLVAGNLTDVLAGQTGGTVIMGINKSTGQSFSKTYDAVGVELPNGIWDFAVVSWDGNAANQIMQGITRCGVVRGIPLNGGEIGVPLTLSSAICNDPFFGFDETKDIATGEPLPILPTTCTDEKGVRETFDAGTCKNSTPLSYRIIYPVQFLDGPINFGLQSTCVSEDTPTTPELDSASNAIRIPIFAPTPNSPPLVIDLHDTTDCSDLPDRRVIQNAYTGEVNKGAAEYNSQGNPGYNEIRISKNPCSSAAGLNPTAPFSPDGATLFALCTATQFINYIPGNSGASYELYADLDFSGSGIFATPVVNVDFTGTFDGRGHTIRNVTFDQTGTDATGLFRQIDGNGSLGGDQANVKNLGLENFSITSSGNSNGALAGNIMIGSTISRIRLRNINLTLNGAATQNHGVLAGNIASTDSAGNGGTYSRVSGINAELVSIQTLANVTRIGGLVGSMEASTELADSTIDGFTYTPNGSNSTNIGGVVGNQVNSKIFGVTAKNISLGIAGSILPAGASQIGGLVGSSQGSEIRNSKSIASLHGGGSNVGGLVGIATGVTFDNNVSDLDMLAPSSGAATGGHIGAVEVQVGKPTSITLSRSFGYVDCSSNSCGGFAGSITQTQTDTISITDSYSKVDVVGAGSDNGGFAGTTNSTIPSQGTTLVGVAAFGYVDGAENTGGLVGNLNYAVVNDSYARNLYVSGAGTNAGGLFGFAGNVTLNRIYSDSPLLGTASVEDQCIATAASNTQTNIYYITDGALDAGCDAAIGTLSADTVGAYTNFTSPPWSGVAGDAIELDYLLALEYVGEEFTGSKTDPIILTTPSQWNGIGDKPPLMDKTYRLGANLDFISEGSFVPIGSSTNPFTGVFQANSYTISNINHVDNTAGAPVGLFAAIGVSSFNGATQIEHQDPFDREIEYALFIDNVHFAKGGGVQGHAGILAGSITDNGDNVNVNGFNDWNKSVQISDVYITNSSVNGGQLSTGSAVGGMTGLFTHTNAQTSLRDIYISYSDVDSAAQSVGTGGMIGKILGPINTGSAFTLRNFDSFILDSVYVTSLGNNVGGLIGSTAASKTTNWEFMIVDNSHVSGVGQVGGIIGNIPNVDEIRTASFQGSVTGTGTDVGGIIGYQNGGQIISSISRGTIDAQGGSAGCLLGKGAGTLPKIENSIGDCSLVTGSIVASYFAVSPNTAPTSPSIYTNPNGDEFITGYTFLTDAQFFDASVTSSLLTAGDPWIFEPNSPPQPFWYYFPEALR